MEKKRKTMPIFIGKINRTQGQKGKAAVHERGKKRCIMKEINYTKHMTMKDAPILRKTGAVAADGEFTPFVWKERLYRLECKILDQEDGSDM
jgi:hypothetical protein